MSQRRPDLVELGHFLRRRREALCPRDVGLPDGAGQRRTPGLRRDEVASIAGISTNYYERLEQGRGPYPSSSVSAAIARSLRLSADERDHLLRLTGRSLPNGVRRVPGDQIDPDLAALMDTLQPTTMALIVTDIGVVLAQNPPARDFFGAFAGRPGQQASLLWRWFTDPVWRNGLYPPEAQDSTAKAYVADLRAALHGRPSPVALKLIQDLRSTSDLFAELWELREVSALRSAPKVLLDPHGHPAHLQCAVVRGQAPNQRLLTFRPLPPG